MHHAKPWCVPFIQPTPTIGKKKIEEKRKSPHFIRFKYSPLLFLAKVFLSRWRGLGGRAIGRRCWIERKERHLTAQPSECRDCFPSSERQGECVCEDWEGGSPFLFIPPLPSPSNLHIQPWVAQRYEVTPVALIINLMQVISNFFHQFWPFFRVPKLRF